MKLFNIRSLIVAAIMVCSCSTNANENVQVVSVDEFQNLIAQHQGYLLDVRTPSEYEQGHIPGAHEANWKDQETFKKVVESLDKDQEILVYCRSGKRSLAAANYLASQGFKVVDLDGGFMAWEAANKPVENGLPTSTNNEKAQATAQQCDKQNIAHDTLTSPTGRNIEIYFVKHASLILDIAGKVVYVDPVTMYGHDFSRMDKADAILVTHGHHDHFDTIAINQVLDPSKTKFITSTEVSDRLGGKSQAVTPAQTIDLGDGITLQTTAAYNTTKEHLQFHPKERQDVGFILDVDGMRIYIAGDTEVIGEMKDYNGVDIAFLPVNQPYTMTPEQAIEAIEIIQPKVVYPYHYGETDLTEIVDKYSSNPNIEVRIRALE